MSFNILFGKLSQSYFPWNFDWIDYHVGKELACHADHECVDYQLKTADDLKQQSLRELCIAAYPLLKEISKVYQANKKNLVCVVNDKAFHYLSKKDSTLELLFQRGCGISIYPHKELNRFHFRWEEGNAFVKWWIEEGEKIVDARSLIVGPNAQK